MKRKFLLVIGLALSLVMILAACSGSGGGIGSASEGVSDGLNYSANEKQSYDENQVYDYDKATGVADGQVDDSQTKSNDETKTQDYLASQKLIYRSSVELETLEFTESVKTIKELINKYNGFVESDRKSDSANDWYYSDYTKSSGTLNETIVIRIPTDKYSEFLSSVEGVGKVISKEENVENITKQYNDTETNIESLKIQESRLLEMMEQAKTIEDMVYVETRLSEVQRQLKSYQSSLSEMDTDIQFSTITVTIREVVKYSPTVVEETFGERIKEAFDSSIESFVDFVQGLVIAIVYMWPFLILLGIIAIVIVIIVKSVSKRRAKKIKEGKIQPNKMYGPQPPYMMPPQQMPPQTNQIPQAPPQKPMDDKKNNEIKTSEDKKVEKEKQPSEKTKNDKK